jgi:glycosyltransferase involved in cell wall biosynthesis
MADSVIMQPLVSVIIPSLNNRRFLEERIASILSQTMSSWELIIVDNYSDDGAWEFFQSVASKDARIRISQAPREGLYANWNNCIRQAIGTYVYIAANDDTMAGDFLEKQASALEQHPECDLAHCPPRMIDESGCEISDWWSSSSIFARSANDQLHRSHVRLAPFDGFLHLAGESVYISLTQLLIRRSLFDRIGLFESRWASIGDFNWCMRASLVANTVHVPDTWGGWRIHSDQATDWVALQSPQHRRTINEMIEHALLSCETNIASKVRSRWLHRARDMREFHPALRVRDDRLGGWMFILRRLLAGSWAAREHVKTKIAGTAGLPETAPEVIRKWLQAVGIDPVIVPATADLFSL